jgi:hypothetical protein
LVRRKRCCWATVLHLGFVGTSIIFDISSFYSYDPGYQAMEPSRR